MSASENEITDLQVVHDAPLLQRDPEAEIEQATIAAKALKRVIDGRSDKVVIHGKTFLRYEDWQTVGQFYGYSVQTDDAQPCEIDGIKGAKAKAILLDKQGNLAGGAEAYCMRDEVKWEKSPWFQLASMAQTRAGAKALRNRLAWVAVLAGYSGTPAEEMDGAEGHGEAKSDIPSCPDCRGPMWDNREGKRNPRAPDFKCKTKSCNGAIWAQDEPKETAQQVAIRELMGQAERLLPPDSKKLAQLRSVTDVTELGQKVQILIDLKKKKSQTAADPKEAERQGWIATVANSFTANEVDSAEYLIENYDGAELSELSTEQLQAINADLNIPF